MLESGVLMKCRGESYHSLERRVGYQLDLLLLTYFCNATSTTTTTTTTTSLPVSRPDLMSKLVVPEIENLQSLIGRQSGAQVGETLLVDTSCSCSCSCPYFYFYSWSCFCSYSCCPTWSSPTQFHSNDRRERCWLWRSRRPSRATLQVVCY